jgi:ribosome recycling factor
MTAQDWAGFILTLISILGAVGLVGRWIVKKYVEDIMSELKPNSGSSMKDQVTRLEDKMDKVFDMMIEHLLKDHSKK